MGQKDGTAVDDQLDGQNFFFFPLFHLFFIFTFSHWLKVVRRDICVYFMLSVGREMKDDQSNFMWIVAVAL